MDVQILGQIWYKIKVSQYSGNYGTQWNSYNESHNSSTLRLAPVSSDWIFILIILFDNPLNETKIISCL